MDKFLWDERGDKLAKRFQLINRFYYKWPVDVAWDSELQCYVISDGKDRILTPRVGRIARYRYGIRERCKKVFESYLLENVTISKEDLVVDCGANVGEFSRHVINEFGCQVICAEPDSQEGACLRENLRGLNASVVEKALWHSAVDLPLYKKNESGDSSLFEVGDHEGTTVVRTTTLDNLLAVDPVRRVRLLKLEAEGAEPEILQGAENSLQRIDFIAADVGPERGLSNEVTAPAVINYLTERDFRLVAIAPKRLVCLFENSSSR